MKTIFIATKNKGKVKEFESFFQKYHLKVKSLLDLSEDIEIIENGRTFKENAFIKAKTVCDIIKLPVLADDSGLEVEYLNNEPGIYSARYAGLHGNDLLNNQKLLEKLHGVPFEKRKARFVCALAIVYPDGKTIETEGECRGYIAEDMRGDRGFGYDPVFYLPDFNKTYAELSDEEKNMISHRGRALEKLEKVLDYDKDNCCE